MDTLEIDKHPDFATQASHYLFAQIAPDVVQIVMPFVERLFAAQSNGDTFIYINQEDVEILTQAQPLVSTNDNTPLVLQGRRLFFAKNWQIERELARQIMRLSAQTDCFFNDFGVRKYLSLWFADEMSRDQQAAAALALIKKFVLISGGPGTGKTTTVAKLLALLCQEDLPRIALLAPTGKASARLSQALRQAVNQIDLPDNILNHLNALYGQTVHRLLGLKPPRMLPEFDEWNRLPLDIVLIDEASMLDNYLFLKLLVALPDSCRVIMLGDSQQLPSVGAGAVMASLAKNTILQPQTKAQLQKILPERHDWTTLSEQAARLTISHRFDDKSGIGQLAKNILSGSLNAWGLFNQFPQELSIQSNNINLLVRELLSEHQLYWRAIENGNVAAAFKEQNRLIVLTALRQDTENINTHYQKLLQQRGKVKSEAAWFAGQMILITRNAPMQNLYNGDVGIVMRSQDDNVLKAYFETENGYEAVPLSRLPEHETAFAITVHKSQGSEYDNVWYFAPENYGASRSLLYTALTRAKKTFTYWGGQDSFQAACQNTETRRSALSLFLTQKEIS